MTVINAKKYYTNVFKIIIFPQKSVLKIKSTSTKRVKNIMKCNEENMKLDGSLKGFK